MTTANPRRSRTGTVYLLHFDQPYKHARHYLGWAADLNQRLMQHQQGHGARLLAVIRQHGITWTLARTWSGTRTRERQIKQQGGASRVCPHCGIRPPQRVWTPGELRPVARRLFAVIDGEWITNKPVITYAARQLSRRITGIPRTITPADLLGWSERTPTMKILNYTTPYIRKDGSVWCVQEDLESGSDNTCRMVVDLETGLTLFLPDYLVDVEADQPISRVGKHPWPLFRWATGADLHSSEIKEKTT
ncbi:hypothetical protein [Amycolatopsis suaedae]|uniref:hypothetical protein n=1 Tax=Amycolatopsis suaedae TaxID=2510978 RepID=UPI00196B9A46|nr:hypothetical protein [Amycolatopsis suaedae]